MSKESPAWAERHEPADADARALDEAGVGRRVADRAPSGDQQQPPLPERRPERGPADRGPTPLDTIARDECGRWVFALELQSLAPTANAESDLGRLFRALPRRARFTFEIGTDPAHEGEVDRVTFRTRVALRGRADRAATLSDTVAVGLAAHLPGLRFSRPAVGERREASGLPNLAMFGRATASYPLAYRGRRSSARLGFSVAPATEASEVVAAVTIPAMVRPAPAPSVVALLLAMPGPAQLRFEIRRTRLGRAEADAIEEQLRLCEGHAQAGLVGAAPDPTLLSPSRLASARALERRLAHRGAALREAAFDLRVSLRSAVPVPASTLRAIGHTLGLEARPRGAGPSPSRQLFTAVELTRALPLPRPGQRIPGISTETVERFPLPPAVPPSAPTVAELFGPRKAVPFGIRGTDRARHVYVSGRTGAGKSTLLARLALSDMAAGESVVVVDPHGDLCQDLVARVPVERVQDVVLIDPTDERLCPSLNPLAYDSESDRRRAIAGFLSSIERMVWDQYGDAAAQMTGPVFWQFLTMVTEAVTSDPARPATPGHIVRFCEDPEYRKGFEPGPLAGDRVRRWLRTIASELAFERPGSSDTLSMSTYITSKLEPCLSHPALRRLLCSPQRPLNLGRALDRGSIVLVNLARAELGEQGSRFFGMLFLSRFVSACFARAGSTQRRPFRLLIDEFGSLATRSVSTLLAEGRKFGASLTLANQYTAQMGKDVAEAVFANCGSFFAFRASASDARRLAAEIGGGLTSRALCTLPPFHAYASLTLGGRQSAPLTVRTRPLDSGLEATAEAIRERCRRDYQSADSSTES